MVCPAIVSVGVEDSGAKLEEFGTELTCSFVGVGDAVIGLDLFVVMFDVLSDGHVEFVGLAD